MRVVRINVSYPIVLSLQNHKVYTIPYQIELNFKATLFIAVDLNTKKNMFENRNRRPPVLWKQYRASRASKYTCDYYTTPVLCYRTPERKEKKVQEYLSHDHKRVKIHVYIHPCGCILVPYMRMVCARTSERAGERKAKNKNQKKRYRVVFSDRCTE